MIGYKKILITGKPGAGKTTLIKKIAIELEGVKIGGFYTEEIREDKYRAGFTIHTFSGERGVLAHKDFQTGPPVGKYRVNLDILEKIGVRALREAMIDADIIIIDEIGRMELFSALFRETVRRCFIAPLPIKGLIATIARKPHPFVEDLKERKDVDIIVVTRINREGLENEIMERIRAGFGNPD